MTFRPQVALSFLMLAACGGGARDVNLSNRGYACVMSEPQDISSHYWPDWGEPLEAGPSTVVVVLSDCHSGSHQDEHASCEVQLDGDVIRVSSEGGYTVPNGPQSADCQTLAASCEGPELSAGTWTLDYAGTAVSFEVPAAGSPCTMNSGLPSDTGA